MNEEPIPSRPPNAVVRPSGEKRAGCPRVVWLFLPLLFLPAAAYGHHGHDAVAPAAGGLLGGFLHPITGWDHLVVMLAIGFWASRQGRHAGWAVPGSFLALLVGGGLLGAALGAPSGWIEAGILLSVGVMVLLIAASIRMPVVAAALVAGGFALFHGYAHGVEMPAGAGALFWAGLLLGSATLHLVGFSTGRLLTLRANRVAGLPPNGDNDC